MDISADALYSRQRALVRSGVLPTIEGRGPGSGVELNSESVAAILIALMAADSLATTDERVLVACNAKPTKTKKCPWTGAPTLQAALATILSSDEKLRHFRYFELYRGIGAAIGRYGSDDTSPLSFHMPGTMNHAIIFITARLLNDTVGKIAKELRSATELGRSA